MELKYNKFYIGLSRDGQAFNFVSFRPKKNKVNLSLKLPSSEELDAKIEGADVETLEYDKRWGQYRLGVTREDIEKKADTLLELMKLAFDRRNQ